MNVETAARGILDLAYESKIQAIKSLRVQSSLSLKEAKDVIDAALDQDFTANALRMIEDALTASPHPEPASEAFHWYDIEIIETVTRVARGRVLVPANLRSAAAVRDMAGAIADDTRAWSAPVTTRAAGNLAQLRTVQVPS